jgi:hypothetical protein
MREAYGGEGGGIGGKGVTGGRETGERRGERTGKEQGDGDFDTINRHCEPRLVGRADVAGGRGRRPHRRFPRDHHGHPDRSLNEFVPHELQRRVAGLIVAAQV